MLLDVIAPIVLVFTLVSAALLTLYESHGHPIAPSVEPDESAPDITPARITSWRARCECLHAREDHPACATGGCGCPRFTYAGGLVEECRADASAAAHERPFAESA